MRLDFNGNKGFRLLNIHELLNKGELIKKAELAKKYGVTEKTIQRDIDDLRAYFFDTRSVDGEVSVIYDKARGGYYLARTEREWITNEEVLVLSKIILESRAFCKEELDELIEKLLVQVSPNDRILVENMIRNEQFYYVPLRHGKKLIRAIWELSKHIAAQEIVQLEYIRQDGLERVHEVKPVSIIFSEYYFYLVAFLADDRHDFPTIFRVDRINRYQSLSSKFKVPYKDRFNDGEFRKRVQFMYSGELRRVKFIFSGTSIEAVLDRLPTAEIIHEKNGVYTISAEVYGNGIEMWIRSQGEKVEVL